MRVKKMEYATCSNTDTISFYTFYAALYSGHTVLMKCRKAT
jgi:hypothetical protein